MEKENIPYRITRYFDTGKNEWRFEATMLYFGTWQHLTDEPTLSGAVNYVTSNDNNGITNIGFNFNEK